MSAKEASWVAEAFWRVSTPWTFLVLICWQPRTRKSSPHLGHRLAALHCPLLANPNIAPAVKGEIPATSSSSIKQERKKKKKVRNGFGN